MIDTQTQPEKQINLLAEYLQARWPDKANDDAVYVAMRLLDRMREAETPQRFAAPMLDAIPDDDASGQIEQLANYLLDKWSAHIRCGGAAENAIAILDQYATPAAAGHDDDEPDDAYLAAKLAGCEEAERVTDASVRLDDLADYLMVKWPERIGPEDGAINLAIDIMEEFRTAPLLEAEPAIPVSRIVAVLAERIAGNRSAARVAREHGDQLAAHELEWATIEDKVVARNFVVGEAVDAELARRKTEANG